MQVFRHLPFTLAGSPALWMLMMALALLATGCAATARVEGALVEVHGVIRDREGAGIEGIAVCLTHPVVGGWNTIVAATTNGRGAFRLHARPGRYVTILYARDLRVPSVFLDSTVVGPSTARLDYQYGGFKVQGRVVGPGGRPVRAGAIEVIGNSPDFRHGLNLGAKLRGGRYVLFLPRGTYYFKTKPMPAYLPSLQRQGVVVSASSDTTVDFSADGNLITGKSTIRNGIPLPSADIEVHGRALPESPEEAARNSTKSDA